MESGLTPIDEKKLNTWTVGMFAFKMFTKTSLLTVLSIPLSWRFTDIYPVLLKNLLGGNLIKFMKEAFPTSEKVRKIADDIISFITLFLNVITANVFISISWKNTNSYEILRKIWNLKFNSIYGKRKRMSTNSLLS